MRPDCTDLKQLFLDDVPMMDMRALSNSTKAPSPAWSTCR
jgi:tRNA 2-selenouridine synthase